MAHVLETSSLDTMLMPARLADVGVRCYVPTYTREVRHARRCESRLMPLYGRYVFAWFPIEEMRLVLKTRGVHSVLRRAGNDLPAVVSDAVIDTIKCTTNVDEFLLNDKLQVIAGRWKGLNGLFGKREADRITVLFSILGQQQAFDFHVSQVMRDSTSHLHQKP